MTDLIRVNGLTVEFRVHQGVMKAVDGASFRVRAGGTTALVGESGSGKSVTAQAILGILPKAGRIAAGEILFADPDRPGEVADLAALDPNGKRMRAVRGGRISMIFQEPMTSLSPLHTVGNQIGEALHLHREVDKKAGHELCVEILRLVGFPNPERAMTTYPFELSGGLRQRAMIAMALVCRPVLLIADEPTTALDVTIQAQILKLIRDLQVELGMAVLIITHDLGIVANMADEVVVMYRGQVVESGLLADIFMCPTHPYLKALMKAVPRFHMAPGERLVPLREIKADATGLLATGQRRPAKSGGPVDILEVAHLSKTFHVRKGAYFGAKAAREVPAVEDVSFRIKRGECLGLVGESGCGKTTTSKLIMRAITPDAGSVTFYDGGGAIDVLSLKDKELKEFRRRIQFIFQDPFGSLSPRMTVFEIISEPFVIHDIGDEKSRADMVQELMRLVGLDPRFLNRYPHSFSGGQRQRIGIARALALRPDILICDEPVSALDVSIQAQILNLLKDLQDQLGLTYLFISHNLAVVDYIADRIAVMCAGRLVEMAPSESLFRDAVHPYTKALLTAVPEPDPNRRLDLHALMEGKASDPEAWPAPFTINGNAHPRLIDLGAGHYVRADPALGEIPEVA